jgi:hypothetical protein
VKLWIGGEIQADIGDAFRDARSSVERAINAEIETKHYDIPLSAWDVIAIIRDDTDFPEISKYSLKKNDMDFRLAIDHEAFKSGTRLEQQRLVYSMLLRSLSLLREKGISGSGIEHLTSDVIGLGQTQGWSS